jgi:hypothetical protein
MAHLMVRPNGRLCRELGSHARQTVWIFIFFIWCYILPQKFDLNERQGVVGIYEKFTVQVLQGTRHIPYAVCSVFVVCSTLSRAQ